MRKNSPWRIHDSNSLTAAEWLAKTCGSDLQIVAKVTLDTTAWVGHLECQPIFAKLYPHAVSAARWQTEAAIAGGGIHPAIVSLRSAVKCSDGMLHLYDRVRGENLGNSDVKVRFAQLPIRDRATAVYTVVAALAAIGDAGFVIVDWYEGNMLYDFETAQVWLFDWELCRVGDSFILEMNSNYGSSRLQAPEEFVRGSRIDGRTLVYNLGRYVLLQLPELAEPLADVLSRATFPAKAGRHASIREFASELRKVLAFTRVLD